MRSLLCVRCTLEQLYSRPAGMRSPSDAKKKELQIYAGKGRSTRKTRFTLESRFKRPGGDQ